VTRRWPLLLLLLAACARPRDRDTPAGSSNPTATADGPRAVPVVALRLGGRGGELRAYALPALAPLRWTLPGRTSAAHGTVGMDVAGRRLLFRDTGDAVVAFDLVAFRERAIAPRGSLADLGADGALLTVDHRGAVVESQPWGSRPWPDTLGPGTRAIFAAPNARLLLLRVRGGDTLVGLSRDGGAYFSAPVPQGAQTVASRDGDAVAFATETGLVVVEDRDPRNPWFVKLRGSPRGVAFSPSGHRIYVALGTRSELAVVDRFQRSARATIALPGPAAALRVDPWGRALFVRPAGAEGAGDVTWVVSAASEHVVGHLATEWDTDLPTVSQTGVILDREGDAVVARDVHSLDSLGAVADGARDYWFLGAWAPAGAAAALRQQARAAEPAPHPAAAPPAAKRAAPAAEPKALRPAPAPDTTARLWVQVSASQSEAASRALVAELAAAHKPVQLVPPRAEGDGWRVVLGPYATRDDAEAAGRALGRPFFIVERSVPAPDHP
jgi:hypothetical protein